MITIGINYIGGPGHDSSAAIAVDGSLKFAIAEERLTRRKQDSSFPIKAIQACLDFEGIKIEEVDEMVFGWPELNKHFATSIKLNFTGALKESFPRQALNYYRSLTSRNVKRYIESYQLKPKKITHLDHHFAHAWSVVPFLESEKSLIFIVDGRGISESTTVYLKNGFDLEVLERINFPNSLGLYYAEMTSMCGFRKYSDEWKVMGLAPFGKKSFDLSHLIASTSGSHTVNHKTLLNVEQLALNGKVIQRPESDEVAINDEDIKDLAHSAQYHYEQTILKFVKYYTNLYSIKSIGMAGGVGLNCKANGYLMRELQLEEFFIQPAATDDGTAIGAALYPFHLNNTIKKEQFYPYLGKEFTNDEIKEVLDKYHLDYQFIDEVEKDAASELAKEKIIGWFQGRDEFGPRALGNRSIVSNPGTAKMKDKVNEVVKYRESWRPFAPSLLKEEAENVLKNIKSSPYMILTDYVSEDYAEKIPAVVHVDGTLRPQTVDKDINLRYWNLINEFYIITGLPVVMNTSFNLKGEPNVCHPSDAVQTFFTSGLDILYLGNYKVKKKP
ncbi:carbamoyltransferase C-terminal domain-containing protein [Salegentibacter sp. F188]|uniref:Carbamoyltransferase C-terminal domain-containing protein n=1 Tax=Autumnicola patrickiae TaxID=3075591 RepID=A0ABU3DYM9_9FLAO|nr:carbamoyltransferase C-terminal domain-containing protein [Salegentibacter sp. F188]MDT0688835.1 carbamoyltransferase C-terminal domain-containing protein [Salegentibacter sp. F188]